MTGRARRPRRRRRHRRVQGRAAAAAVHRVRPRRPRRADGRGPGVRRARRPGPRCPATRCRARSGTASTRCRTSGSARGPTSSSSRRPPPTCWPGPPTGWPTTCSRTPCSPPGARCCSRRRCTPRCGSTPRPGANVDDAARARRRRARPGSGRLTGADTGPGRLPEPERIFAAAAGLLARASGCRPRPGRPARRRLRRGDPRAARPGAVPRQPVVGAAGVALAAAAVRPRRPGHAGGGAAGGAGAGRGARRAGRVGAGDADAVLRPRPTRTSS